MSTKTKSSATKIDVLTLKPSEASVAIKHMLTTNIQNAKLKKKRRGLFLWGPPGIAKSSIIEQICQALNYKLVDIRLTQMEPTDLRGIPVPYDTENGEKLVYWAVPALLPRAAAGSTEARIEKTIFERADDNDTHYDGAVILLDELPNAAPSVQAGSYQLVLDGKLGEYTVPSNAIVIAAGNRETDKGSTFKMPTPLMNRFTHIELREDFGDWQIHALNNNFHKDVVGFLSAFKNKLFDFNPMSASRGFATPRSWETVSDILRGDPNLPEMVKLALVAGTIGDGIAVEFLEYQKNTAVLPDPSDVLDGKVKKIQQVDSSLMYALTTSMCYELKERDRKSKELKDREIVNKAVDNFLGFMMENFKPEIIVMGARTMLATFKISFDSPKVAAWREFSQKFQSLVLD